MPRYEKVFSGDSHIREPYDLWWKTIGNRLGDRTPRIVHEYEGVSGDFFFTGGRICKVITTNVADKDDATADLFVRAGYEPDARLEFQDRADVAGEIIFPSVFSPIMQAGVGDVVHAAAAVYNDWLWDFCSRAPDRLIGMAAVPMYDIDLAIAELERGRRKGLRGALINTVAPDGCPAYKDPAYDPFWAAAQDLDIPIILHIVTGRVLDPIVYAITEEEHREGSQGVFDMWNELHGAVANEFIFGGILDRFPKLKLIDAEYEISWLPHFMFRLDQMQRDFTGLLDLPKLEHAASDYVKHRMWHGMTDDPYGLDTIRHVGASQVMWGSDFPHIRSIDLDTHDVLKELFGTLPAADYGKVTGGNVQRVFNA